jgi:hypothetical protein
MPLNSPLENGHIKSFSERTRDECLNLEVFVVLAEARRKLGMWQHDYNHHRSRSALPDRAPVEFAAVCSGGNDGDKAALENASRFPQSPPHGYGGRHKYDKPADLK